VEPNNEFSDDERLKYIAMMREGLELLERLKVVVDKLKVAISQDMCEVNDDPPTLPNP
jgi:hypothetical protein